MRKLYLLGSSCCFAVCLHAQTVFTAQGTTPLYISPGTVFYADGLAFQPAAGFTITNNHVEKNTTLAHYTANPHVSRVYKFNNTTAPYNGYLGIFYQDTELNGIAESLFEINVHNSSQWQALSTLAFDAGANFVISNIVNLTGLNELTIANRLQALPLKWGNIQAFRTQQSITVSWQTKQEVNIKSFTVERSHDGISWQAVTTNIPAKNSAQGGLYKSVDQQHQPMQVYYRIKQTDFNGQHSFSNVVTVEALDIQNSKMLVYPNPVTESFKLKTISPETVKTVSLYNSAGVLLKSWKGLPVYNIAEQKTGTYLIMVTTTDEQVHSFKITKH